MKRGSNQFRNELSTLCHWPDDILADLLDVLDGILLCLCMRSDHLHNQIGEFPCQCGDGVGWPTGLVEFGLIDIVSKQQLAAIPEVSLDGVWIFEHEGK